MDNRISLDEREVLKRFVKGKKVEPEEYRILEEYSRTGIIKFGFSFKKKEIQAELTEKGKRMLGISSQ